MIDLRRLTAVLLFAIAMPALADPVMLGPRERGLLSGLEAIRGEAVSSKDVDGHAVVVTFFASWCPPCRVEFQHLNTVAGEFDGEALTIVAVNVFEEFDENDAVRLARFLDDTSPRFHVVEGDNAVMQAFGDIQRIPTVFVFDRSGEPVMHFIHARGAKKMSVTEDELRGAITEALSRD